ncbi:MAG: hypothetical protein QM765_22275 [Myxococcales bacterium]
MVGTRLSIVPLRSLAEGGGANALATLVRGGARPEMAAHEAIRRIQGRLGKASAGQLSLVPDAQAAGGLSLPGGAGGELSLLARQKA